MPLPLDRTLKREVLIDGEVHTVTIGPRGVKVTAKGFRKGRALSWPDVLALGREEGPEPTGRGRASGAAPGESTP